MKIRVSQNNQKKHIINFVGESVSGQCHYRVCAATLERLKQPAALQSFSLCKDRSVSMDMDSNGTLHVWSSGLTMAM